jgi:hypothetical protein
MAEVQLDPIRSHAEQAQAILATATGLGYGPHEVFWEPLTASYRVPDDVAEAYANGPDGKAGTGDEPVKGRRGRRPKMIEEPKEPVTPAEGTEEQGGAGDNSGAEGE